MAVTTFSDLLRSMTAESNKTSWKWFLEEAKKARTMAEASAAGDVNSRQAVTDKEIKKYPSSTFTATSSPSATVIGKLMMFQYDPKLKDVLPYYDMFPVIFPIEIYEDGFLGINLHYLPPAYRAKLMDALYTVAIDKEKLTDKMRLQISYKILKNSSKFRNYKPCVKRYLYKHVQGKYSMIEPKQWDTVLFLPLQQFRKATQQTVWNDSINIINKGKR